MSQSSGTIDHAQLQRDGYALLRGAIPAAWLDELRDVFEVGLKPADQWPVPRGPDWRHSMLDLHPRIQDVCRLPEVLQTVGALIGSSYFLAQVEGREPLPGGGQQGRDVKVSISIVSPAGASGPQSLQRSSRQVASAVRRALASN